MTISDAFRSSATLTHTGDWVLVNTYDGFDRVILATDAVGDTLDTGFSGTLSTPYLDPDGRVIQSDMNGPIGGATPTDRSGSTNVLLARSLARFDEAGRQYEAQNQVFVPTTVSLPSSRTVTHTGGGWRATPPGMAAPTSSSTAEPEPAKATPAMCSPERCSTAPVAPSAR